MEWIFDNFFIILVILSGIFGLFGKKEEEKKEKKTNQPRPTPTPSGGYQTSKRSQTPVERKQPTVTLSVDEQKKEQLDRLAGQLKTKSIHSFEDISQQRMKDSSHYAFDNRSIHNPVEQLSRDQVKLKEEISNNLSKKGLIQGIIMAEVLGPPRATKPYRSVIEERKIK
ncbi:hypothetical protein [Oceanobacillus bengalensis]|uniref:Uncharacterized protein n=1 Tax=Oceanobacillus bengalensis TaxID=1435466 RepID=A0A494Z5S0_9BACI|nr:hypothetical protein [Oceanobacillus bengalensis]RKQ17853.1 hypothetical protein D8M05_02915 [Oceanobacillus bengalensis]